MWFSTAKLRQVLKDLQTAFEKAEKFEGGGGQARTQFGIGGGGGAWLVSRQDGFGGAGPGFWDFGSAMGCGWMGDGMEA